MDMNISRSIYGRIDIFVKNRRTAKKVSDTMYSASWGMSFAVFVLLWLLFHQSDSYFHDYQWSNPRAVEQRHKGVMASQITDWTVRYMYMVWSSEQHQSYELRANLGGDRWRFHAMTLWYDMGTWIAQILWQKEPSTIFKVDGGQIENCQFVPWTGYKPILRNHIFSYLVGGPFADPVLSAPGNC